MRKLNLTLFWICVLILTSIPVSVLHSQTLSSYNYSSHRIQLLDGDYYKRLDSINQQLVNWELDRLDRAYEYLDSGDWESALYWANQLQTNKYTSLKCYKCFIQTISYANQNDPKSYVWRYKHLKKNCEPALYRQAQEVFKNLGIQEPVESTNRFRNNLRSGMGIGTGYQKLSSSTNRERSKVRLGLGMGLGYNESGIIDAGGYLVLNKFVMSIGIGDDFEAANLSGQKVMDIGWDEKVWDIVERGTLSSILSIGVGYLIKDQILILIKSISMGNQDYQNCYDVNGVIGYSGSYYKLSEVDLYSSIGLEINYLAGNFLFGLKYDKLNGLGGQLGFIHRFNNN